MYDVKSGNVICDRCGRFIGNINGDGNFFALIRTKYCPECKEPVHREQKRIFEREKRHRQRQARKLVKEQNDLLKQENNLLREQIKELRRKTS